MKERKILTIMECMERDGLFVRDSDAPDVRERKTKIITQWIDNCIRDLDIKINEANTAGSH